MNLLVRTARDLRRLVTADFGFTLAVALMGVALEVFGRQTAHVGYDLHDLFAFSTIILIGILVVVRHRHSPLGWVSAIASAGRRVGAWLRGWTFEIGLDLRGQPPVKRGSPPAVRALGVIFAAWAVIAAGLASAFPNQIRSIAAGTFYLGYLTLLTALWFGILAMILLSAFLPFALIHDRCVSAHTGPSPRRRKPEYAACGVYFGAILVIGAVLPVSYALGWCGAIMASYLLVCRLPSRGDIRFLWRPYGTVRVRSLTWGAWVTWEFILITLAIVALVLTALGERVLGAAAVPETMPVTALLGLILAWLAPGALTALLAQMILGRYFDPARPARPVVHIAHGDEHRSELRRLFRLHGWKVRFAPAAPGPLDARIVLTESQLPATTDEPRWPLVVTLNELHTDAGVWERFFRRVEIQSRRKVVSGLEQLFKLAAGRPARGGNGYWVAPHLWFIAGLMRDGDDEPDLTDNTILSRTAGPPYHRIMPRAARHHLYRMMRALKVDLIFVEDGVAFRRLRKVLRVLFETYDVHGGRRQAEEIDFRGLPKTRVLIHEFQFDEPFRSEVYPEPKYDYLGRARILHIFRDRGEQEEPLETPFDFSRTRTPVGAY